MKVGFFHVNRADGTTNLDVVITMMQSVRRAMPDVELWHFRYADTPQLATVDGSMVQPKGPLALACLRAFAQCTGDWLFIDTDVVIQRDVRKVFDEPFDIAVAERDGTLRDKEIGTKFMASMPYNKGAVFSRSQAFWEAAVARLEEMSAKRREWMGDQHAMNVVIAEGQFQVKVLPNTFNYPPFSAHEDVRNKAILHYKGPRKPWMLQRRAS